LNQQNNCGTLEHNDNTAKIFKILAISLSILQNLSNKH